MFFYVEPFKYEDHMHLLIDFVPGEISRVELLAHVGPSFPEGTSIDTLLVHCVLLSYETWVFRCTETRKILGIGGLSKPPIDGVICPWYLSRGFEPLCPVEFFRAARDLVLYWQKTLPPRMGMVNLCLNTPRVVKFLRALGFTVEDSPGKFVKFSYYPKEWEAHDNV